MAMPTFGQKQWTHVLVNTEDGHKKFWLARQEGDEYVVCDGRLGTNGKTKRFKGDPWEKAREKESSGYEAISMRSLLRIYYDASLPQETAASSEQQAGAKKPRKRMKKLGALPQAKNWDW